MKLTEKMFQKVYKQDSRKLDAILSEKVVDVTITSPPYFDLKDYGYKNQIGYGQKYDVYLDDLKKVFTNVYNCTKDNGTLWVIIDSFRRNNEVTPLPFDFSNKLKEVGWKLQEIIIWAKDRTVPWAHKGQMRNLFEYILLFSKSDKYNFFIDEVRDFEALKKWWIKYPERYNPKGKTPDGLWHFDIPTQGSWGNGYIKHFCPLPEEMIEQILKISSREGDVILDPFAGSGAVLAKADNMKRKYIGFELNASYIKMFQTYLKDTGTQKGEIYERQKQVILPQKKFTSLIIELRALKFARVLFSKIPEKIADKILKIYVDIRSEKVTKRNAICVVEYVILIKTKTDQNKILALLNVLVSKPPLSKFGIQYQFKIVANINDFLPLLKSANDLYTYTTSVTNKYKNAIKCHEISKTNRSELILSKIKVDLNEKDYE